MQSCPERQVVLNLVSGQVSEAEAAPVAEHFNSCERCQSVADSVPVWGELQQFRDSVARLRSAPFETDDALSAVTNEVVNRLKTAVINKRRQLESAEQPAEAEEMPEQIGDYEVLAELGHGGMGTVYLAFLPSLAKRYAIKLVRADRNSRGNVLERFEREMQLLANLDPHLNVVKVQFGGRHEGRPYLVMDYLSGTNLEQLVRHRGSLPVGEACELMIQAARGLGHIHRSGVVHRDVKPSNLVLSRDGIVRLVDFGLVHLSPEQSGVLGGNRDGLTAAGVVMGSVDFMAPEQAEDTSAVDRRADIYSLGCTLAWLLTGRPLFDGPTPTAVIFAHREKSMPSLCDLRADIPREVDAVFQKMVTRDRDRRFQSMEEVIQALKPFADAATDRDVAYRLAGETIAPLEETVVLKRDAAQTANPGRMTPGKNRSGVMTAVAGFGIALLGLILVLKFDDGSEQKVSVSKSEGQVQITISTGSGTTANGQEPVEIRVEGNSNSVTVAGDASASGIKIGATDERLLKGFLLELPAGNSTATPVAVLNFAPSIDASPNEDSGNVANLSNAGRISDLHFLPQSSQVLIAVGGRVLRVDIADVSAPLIVKEWTLSEREVISLALLPDNSGFVAAGHDGVTRLVRFDAEQPEAEFPASGAGAIAVTLSPDAKTVLVGHWGQSSGRIRIWDLASGVLKRTVEFDSQVARCLTWSPDQSQLAVGGGGGGSVAFWKPDLSGELRELPQGAGVLSVKFSPDGKLLATTSQSAVLRVWDVASGEQLWRVKGPGHRGYLYDCEFSPDGSLLAVGDENSMVVFDVKTRAMTDRIQTGTFADLIRFSPDGRQIFTASGRVNTLGGNGLVRVFETPHPGSLPAEKNVEPASEADAL